MARLSDYPTKINGTTLQRPTSWQESYDVVEKVYQTEAGTDQIDALRYGKLTITAAFDCDSAGVARFAAWSNADTLAVKIFDLKDIGYITHTMRMRDFKVSRKEDSEWVRNTYGLYEVSFKLEDF